ncbi:MAG: hypothetical protein F6K54_21840 [Okeania sp. SIO3B5]|uniref:hypothetical protein n=1 Tax=Okeania sp. SIO3B5 TaxID=2607811 RepID=UPI0013FF81EF|nr:hypothetical protein [Okeania sp. SIO3B5]NEO55480.1 hypothetical protein [Okeania sp. SIO3B5]
MPYSLHLTLQEVPISAAAIAAKIALNPQQQFNSKISDRFQKTILQGMAFHL